MRTRDAITHGVFSVMDVAKMLSISCPTVRRLCDNDKFPGSYRIPTSKDRRIPAPAVDFYLKENGIPVPRELSKYLLAYQKNFKSSLERKPE